jgi:hypothetical protein
MIAGVEEAAAYCRCGHAEPQFPAQPEFSLGVVHLGRGGRRLLHLWHEAAVDDPLSGRVCHDGHVVHRAERAGDDARLPRGDVRRLVADETRLLTVPTAVGSGWASKLPPKSATNSFVALQT